MWFRYGFIWQRFLGAFFSFTFPGKLTKERYYPIYYFEGESKNVALEGSVNPIPQLPEVGWEKIIEASLPGSDHFFTFYPVTKKIPFTSPSFPSLKEVLNLPSFNFPFIMRKEKKSTLPSLKWEGKEREIVYAPVPSYPLWAEIRGWEGEVELEFNVSKEGEVEEVKVIRSTGHHPLDVFAVECLYRWKFSPGEEKTKGRIRFVFKLEK